MASFSGITWNILRNPRPGQVTIVVVAVRVALHALLAHDTTLIWTTRTGAIDHAATSGTLAVARADTAGAISAAGGGRRPRGGQKARAAKRE